MPNAGQRRQDRSISSNLPRRHLTTKLASFMAEMSKQDHDNEHCMPSQGAAPRRSLSLAWSSIYDNARYTELAARPSRVEGNEGKKAQCKQSWDKHLKRIQNRGGQGNAKTGCLQFSCELSYPQDEGNWRDRGCDCRNMCVK